MRWITLGIPVLFLALLVMVSFADTTPFQPSYDLVSLSPSTRGLHGDVVQHIAAPLGDHAIGYLKFTLPAGWAVAGVQNGNITNDEPIVGAGNLQIDVGSPATSGCDGVPENYPLTIFDDGKYPGDTADVITNWVAQGYQFQQLTFTVRTITNGVTIESYFFTTPPEVCTPMILDLTFQGVSSDNPASTTDNEAGRTVLTQPATAGVYTWSVLFESYPLTSPPGQITRCDQVKVTNPNDSTTAPDGDGDGIADGCDNCPNTPNADQRDFNLNGIGDACDPDADGDGVLNTGDLCPFTPLSQRPVDANGCSQAQVDPDLDGICDPGKSSTFCTGSDNCPTAYNPAQADWNNNGIGDACEDFDNDGKLDSVDNCKTVYNPIQEDINNNGIGDACDPEDFDGDGFSDRVEFAVGTDPGVKCATYPTQDAWPADINNDTVSDITDLSAVAGSFGKAVPPAPARYDIAPDPPDRFVDITDIARMAGLFGRSCL